VLFRAKSNDPAAAWGLVTASADLAITNEFAVYLGDRYDVKESLVVVAATATPVLAIRRHARLKEYLPKTVNVTGGFTQPHFLLMKEVLKIQGIILEDSLTAITA
jgi:hypothetical protein